MTFVQILWTLFYVYRHNIILSDILRESFLILPQYDRELHVVVLYYPVISPSISLQLSYQPARAPPRYCMSLHVMWSRDLNTRL